MRTIDDNTLDRLITQSLQREHDIEQINATILKVAKRHNRIRNIKKIVRLLAVAIGVPTMLVMMGYGAYRVVMMDNGVFGYVATAITIISAVAMTTYSLAIFSFDEV